MQQGRFSRHCTTWSAENGSVTSKWKIAPDRNREFSYYRLAEKGKKQLVSEESHCKQMAGLYTGDAACRLRRKEMRWWQIRKRDEDLERELQSDLELEEEEQRENGLSPEEARYAARRAFGNRTLIKEQTHEAWGCAPFERLLQDLRYALRQLRRSPGFAAAVILTLALGIGASTSIFSVVDAELLRPLPYPNPQQIVRIWEQDPDGHRMNLAQLNFDDFHTQNDTLTSLAEYGYRLTSVAGSSDPVRATVASVSRDFFETLGVEPFRGRTFVADEQRLHGAPSAIVSYGYWKQYLGGAADLSRFLLKIAGADYAIVGVMPAGFDFPLRRHRMDSKRTRSGHFRPYSA